MAEEHAVSDDRIDADEALLLEILERRVAPDGREANELFSRRPELRSLLPDLELAMHHIERTAAADRELVTEVANAIRADDRARVEAFVRARLGAVDPPRPASRPRWLALAAALLVIVAGGALWVALRDEGSRGRPAEHWLGAPPRLLEPGDEASAFSRFAWAFPDGKPARVALEIWEDAGAGKRGRLLLRRTTEQSEWTLSADETRAWPDAVLWSVTMVDAAGEDVPGKSVSRSSRRSH